MEILTLEIVHHLLKECNQDLKSTQEKLCFPVVQRIHRKMLAGIKFKGIKVDGELIIDGHHRYIASLLAGAKMEIVPWKSSSATSPVSWHTVSLVLEDWDTEAKIHILNEEDAVYNGLDIASFTALLK